MRKSVEAVLLVHDHGHPHVLLLQLANSTFFKLPDGNLNPGEDPIEGLSRNLYEKFGNPSLSSCPTINTKNPSMTATSWQIGDCLAVWYRPQFETHLVSSENILVLFFRCS